MMDNPDFELSELERENLEVHEIANGLAYLVSGPDHAPAIQSSGVQMEVCLSKINGEFVIIR